MCICGRFRSSKQAAAPSLPKVQACHCSKYAAPCLSPAAVTWDDGISPFSYGLVQKILGGLKQRNDCPIPSTFYISTTGARCVIVGGLAGAGALG